MSTTQNLVVSCPCSCPIPSRPKNGGNTWRFTEPVPENYLKLGTIISSPGGTISVRDS